MLEFYATSGDFTRRLTSIKANAKFSSPLAGPEEYYSVRNASNFACIALSSKWRWNAPCQSLVSILIKCLPAASNSMQWHMRYMQLLP